MTQYFKGDAEELKYLAIWRAAQSVQSVDLDTFFEEAFNCLPLGEVLFDTKRAPLTNAINRDIFVTAFAEIIEAFVNAGSAEAYLTVFRKIFGEDVSVQFTVPNPGHLVIDIETPGGIDSVEESIFVAREIDDGQYVFYEVITQDGLDTIVFSTVKGFTSQYELERMLFEMVPEGIYTEINLTILGEG